MESKTKEIGESKPRDIAQYDEIKTSYAELASAEPSKQFVQYPEMLRLLGDVKGKNILDVGCGPGLLTRQIAQRGANVIAYDVSVEQISIALSEEKQNPLAIQYIVADPSNVEEALKDKLGMAISDFDIAISTLVLHYAEDSTHLDQFFSSTYRLLVEGGRFIAIISNPNYSKLGKKAYNRIFYRTNGKMKADFLDPAGVVKFSISYSDFSREDYEKSAVRAGFRKIEWSSLQITKEGLEKMGEEFWGDFEEDCPYVVFVAFK